MQDHSVLFSDTYPRKVKANSLLSKDLYMDIAGFWLFPPPHPLITFKLERPEVYNKWGNTLKGCLLSCTVVFLRTFSKVYNNNSLGAWDYEIRAGGSGEF